MRRGLAAGEDVLLVVDVQETFDPPAWLVQQIAGLARTVRTFATVELHDEASTPFLQQLGWAPRAQDTCLVPADRVFIKHGYLPPADAVAHLKALVPRRVLVCGLQADTCVLAAGFALFDAGLQPTLVTDLVVGSSLDRGGSLGVRLWEHHFAATANSRTILSQSGGV